MGREKLTLFRLLTPGILAAFFCYTVIDPHFSTASLSGEYKLWGGLATLLCILIGWPYRVLNVRSLFLRDFWKTIDENICTHLIDIARSRIAISRDQEIFLRQKRRLMDVFYRIVDNDENLTQKSKGIYFNGYMTTLGVDMVTLGLLAIVAHGIASVFGETRAQLWWAAIILVTTAFAYMLFRQSIKRHKMLSNEQLRIIGTFHDVDVCKSIKRILRQMPGAATQTTKRES